MQITLSQLYNLNDVLSKHISEPMGIKTSYKLLKFLRSIENDVQFFVDKLRGLYKEYEFEEVDGQYKIKDASLIPEYNEKIKELGETEIGIADIEFDIEELSDWKLSPIDLGQIEKIIKKEEV
jgi:hypothetical protein